MDPVAALAAVGGVARYVTLRRLGVSDRALTNAVAAGTVRRLDGAGYALPDAPPGSVVAVRCGGVASHVTAAKLHGLETWTPTDSLHVTVPLGSHPKLDGVVVHRCDLAAADVDPHRPLTRPLRTVLDCGRSMSLLEAVVVLDAALRRQKVRLATLRAAAAAARGHGSAALRRAVAYVDVLSESPLESVLGLLIQLTDAQIRRQVIIPGVGRVDFLIDGWLVLEGDGFEFHADRESYRRDRYRGNALTEGPYRLLRFTWEDLYFRKWETLQVIERVRAQGPPHRRVG